MQCPEAGQELHPDNIQQVLFVSLSQATCVWWPVRAAALLFNSQTKNLLDVFHVLLCNLILSSEYKDEKTQAHEIDYQKFKQRREDTGLPVWFPSLLHCQRGWKKWGGVGGSLPKRENAFRARRWGGARVSQMPVIHIWPLRCHPVTNHLACLFPL